MCVRKMAPGDPLFPHVSLRNQLGVPSVQTAQVEMMMDLAKPFEKLRDVCTRTGLDHVRTGDFQVRKNHRVGGKAKRGRRDTSGSGIKRAAGAPYLDPAEMAKSSRSVGLRERKRPEGCKALMDERRRGGPGRQCAGLSRIVDHSDGGALGTLPPNATLQSNATECSPSPASSAAATPVQSWSSPGPGPTESNPQEMTETSSRLGGPTGEGVVENDGIAMTSPERQLLSPATTLQGNGGEVPSGASTATSPEPASEKSSVQSTAMVSLTEGQVRSEEDTTEKRSTTNTRSPCRGGASREVNRRPAKGRKLRGGLLSRPAARPVRIRRDPSSGKGRDDDGNGGQDPFVKLKGLPKLPAVDDHQAPAFCLAEMHRCMRKDRDSLRTPYARKAARSRRGSPPKEGTSSPAGDGRAPRSSSRPITGDEEDLTTVVRYLMRFGARAGRSELRLQDLESAFRASRRAGAFLAIEEKGKSAFAKCLRMLHAHGLSPEAWCEEMVSKNRWGKNLTTFDLGMSIRAYNRSKPSWMRSHKRWLRTFMMSEKDVRWCLRFVDPDGAVSLTLEFERFMSESRTRLVDLLEKVDKDRDGSINQDELRAFLLLGRQRPIKDAEGHTQPSWYRRMQLAEQQQERARSEIRTRALQAKQRLARARETGAIDVIKSLKDFTKVSGLRVSDLIQATGADPDKGMSPTQLEEFFARLKHPTIQSLTRADLKRIMKFLDQNEDGLLSLAELQFALTRYNRDELVLMQLAKAVSVHVANSAAEADEFEQEQQEQQNQKQKQDVPPHTAATTLPAINAACELGRTIVAVPTCDPPGNLPARRDNGPNIVRVSPGSDVATTLRAARDSTCSSGSASFGSENGLGVVPGLSSALMRRLGASVEENYMWILDDDSNIDSVTSEEGLSLEEASTGGRRVPEHRLDPSVPRTTFRVQAGSNLDSSWLKDFDQRFECQRRSQADRLPQGSRTWYAS